MTAKEREFPLGNLGIAYRVLGNFKKAIEYQEQALAIAREIGDHRSEGRALGNLGNVYVDLGDLKNAAEYLEKDLAISRQLGNRYSEGNILGNLGIVRARMGKITKPSSSSSSSWLSLGRLAIAGENVTG